MTAPALGVEGPVGPLIELDGQGSGGTTVAGGDLALVDPRLDQRLEAVVRVGELLQPAGEFVQVRAVLGQRGLDQLVLGLEVVVHVPTGTSASRAMSPGVVRSTPCSYRTRAAADVSR